MKYAIAILALFCAGLVCEVNAVTFEEIERFWTESPPNSVLYTPNQSESVQPLEIKKTIDSDHPLMLTAELINKDTGAVMYSGSDLNICTRYEGDSQTFQKALVRLFNRCFFGKRKSTCPVTAQEREIYRSQYDLITTVNLSPGSYEVTYTATDDGELVFSTVKFRFNVQGAGGGWWGK